MTGNRVGRFAVAALALLLVTAGILAVVATRSVQCVVPTETEEVAETMNTEHAKKVFNSPLAGMWYDADKQRLSAEIDRYIAEAGTSPLENVQALVLPHAGYRYSGPVAAFGLKAVLGREYTRVIVMGPSHRVYMHGCAHVSDMTHLATPLGEVPLDLEAAAALRTHPEFRVIRGVDESEHSVQIQVPLLQRALKDFRLVPIVVGNVDGETIERMAAILQGIVDDKTLVVASSDFTHYGRDYGYVPFEDNISVNLEKLDMGAWEKIQKKDAAGFADYVEDTGATICGRYPISILLSMLPADSQAHLLKYDTSGRVTGDERMSVSYLSLAFTGTWPSAASVKGETPSTGAVLSEEDKAGLLALARGMLETYVKSGKTASPEELGITVTAGMRQVMGAFVTLHIGGELRGCIGEIFPRRPLFKAVMERAVDAGVKDPRFRPVSKQELPLLHYEISALTPPVPVASYKEIVLGRHGMVMEKNGRSAVFLPQVAPEQHWTLEETLTHLSMKAGLSSDAWKEGASWTVFEAIVFEEET